MGRDSISSKVLLGFIAICCFAGGMPVRAADDVQTLPKVTVTGTGNPGETPVETAYAGTIFQRLEKASRYPTGREASEERPSGTAKVWFELQRNGKVAGHGVEQSSGSQLLDRMALTLVTRQKYPALPQDGWPDGAKHRFVVSYKFDGNAAGAASSTPRAPKK